ncbi:signal recognition particle-docking protein FtsY [Candidatus Woesearchaeota archaeon]|nr:signal recognition particle-docking protein FtsY [Candidatus Woesearchaeota archaeon]
MFSFLKDKLKKAVRAFSKKVEEATEVVEETPVAKKAAPVQKPAIKKLAKKPKKSSGKAQNKPSAPQTLAPTKQEPSKPTTLEQGFFSRVFGFGKKETLPEAVKELPKETEPSETALKPETKPETLEVPGFFTRLGEKIVSKKINDKEFENMFWELEVGLLENNVAVEVIEKIKTDLKNELVNTPIRRGQIEETIIAALRKSISTLFIHKQIDLIKNAKEASAKKKPFVICLVGINGSGKTTSVAKLTHYLQKHGLDVVISASDTFRAAAIDQLQLHADKLGVKLIKHDYGSDPAAVAFDAIKHAQSKGKQIVLIDTAGRMQSNVNLMDEMQKIVRVAKPDLTIFIGESITGNDCVEQARSFDEAVGIDGIILSKADIDEKGGAAISVSYVTKKPILFLGVGQGYDDLKPFDPTIVMQGLGF